MHLHRPNPHKLAPEIPQPVPKALNPQEHIAGSIQPLPKDNLPKPTLLGADNLPRQLILVLLIFNPLGQLTQLYDMD